MAQDFGFRIGVNGEKEVSEAIKNINQNFNLLKSESKLVAAQFDAQDKSAEALTARNNVLNKTVENQKDKIGVLQQALQQAAEKFGEGSKEANKWETQLNTAKAQLIGMEKELSKNNDELKKFADNDPQKVTDSIKGLGSSIKDLGTENLKKIDTAITTLAHPVEAAKEGFSKLGDTLKGKITDSIDGMAGKIKSLGKDEENAADDTDKLDGELKQAADTADDSGSAFSALGDTVKGIGVAIGAAFAAVGAATIAATKALADMSVGTAAYADEILTQSTVTGMSTEALQAYSYAAELVDVSLDTVTGSMAKNVKSMNAARGGTGAAADAYKQLGVSVTDSNGKLRDGEEVYWASIDALGKMEEGAERDALAMSLFGKSAQALNPLIATGSEGIAELTAEARKMGAILSDSQLDQAGAFDDAIQRLTSGSNSAKNALGMVLMPQLTELGDTGANLLGEFASAVNEATSSGDWSNFSSFIGEVIGEIASLANELIPQMVTLASEILSSLAKGVMDNLPEFMGIISQTATTVLNLLVEMLPSLTGIAVQLITTLATVLIENLPQIIGAATQIITSVITGISEALPELIPAVVECVVLIVDTLIDNLPLLLGAALKLMKGLTKGLLDALPILVEKLPELILSITNFITASVPQIIEVGLQLFSSLIDALPTIIENILAVLPLIIESVITALLGSIPLIIDAGTTLFISLVDALPQIIDTIVAALPQIINSVITALIGSIPQIITAGVKLITALITNLPQIILTIVAVIPEILKAIVEGLGAGVSQLAGVGFDLIKGLWQGISDSAEWLWDKIKGFTSAVTDKIKGFFGIHSPSTEMRDGVGKNLALGIGLGFSDEMPNIIKAMQGALPTDFDTNVNLNTKTKIIGDPFKGLDFQRELDDAAYNMSQITANANSSDGLLLDETNVSYPITQNVTLNLNVNNELDIDRVTDRIYYNLEDLKKRNAFQRGVTYA